VGIGDIQAKRHMVGIQCSYLVMRMKHWRRFGYERMGVNIGSSKGLRLLASSVTNGITH
jgi:hypothetical protein